MDRTRLSPGNCSRLSSGQARLLQSGRSLERRPAPGMGLDSVSAHDLKRRGSPCRCINQAALEACLKAARRRRAMPVPPTSYGDLFGEAVAEAEVAAPAAGDGAPASPGFTLISSTSKRSVALGPISPPVPPGP